VSSSLGGRVSPTIAKLSSETGPPEEEEEVDVLVLDEVLEELLLDEVLEELVLPPPHEGPHADMASVTHWLSHLLSQQ
jgi:hypothetical protein